MVVLGASIAQWLTFVIESNGVVYTFVYLDKAQAYLFKAQQRGRLKRRRAEIADLAERHKVPFRLNFPARQLQHFLQI